ncbi:hypothetical protein IBX73_10050 [candidate division WOR-3 bacterium]|nr:hypothetical protein [candidate division WOR-3 bacterium]
MKVPEKVDFLKNFDEILEQHRYGIFFSLLSCLGSEETCLVLDINFEQDNNTRRATMRKISADLKIEILPCHTELFQKISDNLYELVSTKKEKAATFIDLFISHMPADCQEEAVCRFTKSQSKAMRKRAVGWLNRVKCNEKYQEILLEAWHQHKTAELATSVISNCDPDCLLANYNDLSQIVEKTPAYSKLHLRIASLDMSKIRNQEAKDPVAYAYLMAKLGLKIATNRAIALYEKVAKAGGNTGLLIGVMVRCNCGMHSLQ